MPTNTYNQAGQTIHGTQVNIAQANLNLPPQIEAALLEILKQDEAEDLTVAQLTVAEFEPETVFIEAGVFTMGSQPGEDGQIPEFETPEFDLRLPAYRIGKYPVTNGQFARFLKETEQPAWLELGWGNGNRPTDEEVDQPVKGVTWYGALRYCLWLIEETGRPYTLPSEAQWEKAARGPDGNIFPWGDDWQDGRHCNTNSNLVTPIDAFETGVSEYGCYDMVGNIREWTTSLWGRNRRYNLDLRSPYPLTNEREPIAELKVNKQIRRITRGGASLAPDIELRAARRESELPYRCGITNNRVGFRVALNLDGEK